jgi:hypothetical protein
MQPCHASAQLCKLSTQNLPRGLHTGPARRGVRLHDAADVYRAAQELCKSKLSMEEGTAVSRASSASDMDEETDACLTSTRPGSLALTPICTPTEGTMTENSCHMALALDDGTACWMLCRRSAAHRRHNALWHLSPHSRVQLLHT